ncbi:hypothetical protein HF072_07455 [Bacillus sp. RO3]|nr:hypothetical protein [Bacillus sp. RO3]
MFNNFKKALMSENEVYLGEKKVQIRKVTPLLWKEMFGLLDKLPGLVMQVVLAPKNDYYQTLLVALDVAFDEVLEVVSLLSGIEKSYLEGNAGIDEIVLYLSKMAKHNNLGETAKNLKSLLSKNQEA